MPLGKRKRDGEELTVNEPKHARLQSGIHTTITSSQYDSSGAARRPTAIHLVRCPMFRLPAELRTRIWTYAFGNSTIDVSLQSPNRSAKDGHDHLIFEHAMYSSRNRVKLPPRVCRQFYSETTAAFYATTSFTFHSPHTFRTFALSPQAHVGKLQYLCLPRFNPEYGNVLTTSLIARLKSLRGVRISYNYHRRVEAWPVPRALSPGLKCLWRIIRTFQQHELETSHTLFEVIVHNSFRGTHQNGYGGFGDQDFRLRPGEPQYDDMVQLQKDLTEGLLRYIPRRTSKRSVV